MHFSLLPVQWPIDGVVGPGGQRPAEVELGLVQDGPGEKKHSVCQKNTERNIGNGKNMTLVHERLIRLIVEVITNYTLSRDCKFI